MLSLLAMRMRFPAETAAKLGTTAAAPTIDMMTVSTSGSQAALRIASGPATTVRCLTPSCARASFKGLQADSSATPTISGCQTLASCASLATFVLAVITRT